MHTKTRGKWLSIILYFAYCILLLWMILPGASKMYVLLNEVELLLQTKNIQTVELSIDTDEPLLAGREIEIAYEAKSPDGKKIDKPGLHFKSLTPDVLKVYNDGTVYASTGFSGDEITAQMRITSKYSKKFEQIVTLRFIKVYPEDFRVKYYVLGCDSNAPTLYVGAPITVKSNVKSGTYNVTDYEIVYDSTYFSYDQSTKQVTPIQPTPAGETLRLGVRYANGETRYSNTFAILPISEAPTEFDEVRIGSTPLDGYSGPRKALSAITLYKDGKRVQTPYQATLREGDDGSLSYGGSLSYKTPGEKQVTITLPSGFTKTCNFRLFNVISLPTILDMEFNEDGALELSEFKSKSFKVVFEDKRQTYYTVQMQYDKSMLSVSLKSGVLKIKALDAGQTTLTLYLDDGEKRVETQIEVDIAPNKSLVTYIQTHDSEIRAKMIGHFSLFAVLAFFSWNMFQRLGIEDERKRMILHPMTALPWAIVTEMIQLFMPSRHGRLVDVFIDMGGFYFGTLLAALVFAGIRMMGSDFDKRR